MTTTALLTSQSVGTSTNVGTGLYAGQLVLQTATAGLVLSAQLTAGAGATLDRKHQLRVWLATSPFNVSTGIPIQFENDAREMELNVPANPSSVRATTSPFVLNLGGYLYYWLEVPALPVAATLNLSCVEI